VRRRRTAKDGLRRSNTGAVGLLAAAIGGAAAPAAAPAAAAPKADADLVEVATIDEGHFGERALLPNKKYLSSCVAVSRATSQLRHRL